MSITFWEGFETYPWSTFYLGSYFGNPHLSATEGRGGGGCLVLTDTLCYAFPPLSDGVISFAFKMPAIERPFRLFTLFGQCTWFHSTLPHHLNIHSDIESRGGILVTQAGQLAWQVSQRNTSSNPFIEADWAHNSYLGAPVRMGAWNHLEVHIYPGYIWLWLNGALVQGGPIGADTANNTNLTYPPPVDNCEGIGLCCLPPHFPKYHSTIMLGGRTTYQRLGQTVYFDDFYLATLPAVQGTPYGDLAISKFLPGADGDYADWTPAPSGDHYAQVDEDPNDGDTSYVYTDAAGVGDRDTYHMDIGDHTGSPLIVAPYLIGKQTNIGRRDLKLISKLGASEELTPAFMMTPRYPPAYVIDPPMLYSFGLDAAGNPWTWENLADAEFGMEVYL